jgi:hypothetical protein
MINMVKEHFLAPPLATQNLVLQDLEGYRTSRCLNNNDWKQVIQTINKKVHRTVPK